MTRWRAITGLIAALPLAACAASVGPSAPATSQHGRVTGTLRREGGPLRPGGRQPEQRPLPGTIQFARGGHQLITIQVGHSGTFSIRLRAGTYRVSGRSPQVTEITDGTSRETACSLPVKVTVIPRHTLHIALVCIVP